MDPEILLYDHTIRKFLSGENAVGDTFRINLYSAFTMLPGAVTKAEAELGATQLPTLNGYTQNNTTLNSKVVNTFNTTDALLTATSVTWTAAGGSLSATWAMCYNDTDTNDPPIFAVDFKDTKTVADGVPLVIAWPAAGIIIAVKPTP